MPELDSYSAVAVNTDPDHENRIHSDEVAAKFGFRGGLVPGVNVYGYLTVPVLRHYGKQWVESGWIRVRFREPFYEGGEGMVNSVLPDGGIQIDARPARAG